MRGSWTVNTDCFGERRGGKPRNTSREEPEVKRGKGEFNGQGEADEAHRR